MSAPFPIPGPEAVRLANVVEYPGRVFPAALTAFHPPWKRIDWRGRARTCLFHKQFFRLAPTPGGSRTLAVPGEP